MGFYHCDAIKDVITKDSENEKLSKEYFNSIKNEDEKVKIFSTSENNFRSSKSKTNRQKSLIKSENILYVHKTKKINKIL